MYNYNNYRIPPIPPNLTNLLNSRLGDKHVTAVPGIGPATAQRMGTTRAYQLLGIYLLDPCLPNFQATLWSKFGVYANNAGVAYNALQDMVAKYMPMQTTFYCFDIAFVNIPLGAKPVIAVPGIGPQRAPMFAARGITQASQLLGLYLRDPSNFQATLWDEFKVNHHWSRVARDALYDVSRYIV